MNERIQELWRECILKHTNDPMNWQAVADEFAEAIIRECIDGADAAERWGSAPFIVEQMKKRLRS